MALTFYVKPADFCGYSPPASEGDAPAVVHTTATMTVINVREFIDACYPVSPTPAETADAIRCAAEAIPDEGGILYFPEGLYEVNPGCPPLSLKSRTWMR